MSIYSASVQLQLKTFLVWQFFQTSLFSHNEKCLRPFELSRKNTAADLNETLFRRCTPQNRLREAIAHRLPQRKNI